MNDKLISVYQNRFGTSPTGITTIDDYLENIKNGTWEDFVLDVRNGKKEKDNASGVTVSAKFKANRKADMLETHSGFLAIDIDDKDNEGLVEKRPQLEADPHCYSCHHSIRGFGLVWYVKIDGSRHKDAFYAIEKYLANKYEINVDPSGKDVSRFRFVSYDPALYLNRKSKTWRKYLPKKEVQVFSPSKVAFHNEDFDFIIEQIKTKGANICEDYDSWLKTGFALASEFGETGRQYFHLVSSQSSKYDAKKVDRQYDISLRRKGGGITIGTFFHYCKEAGVEILTQTTKDIVSVGKQRLKSSRNKEDAIKATTEYFQTIQGLSEERTSPVLEKLKEVPISVLKSEKIDDKTKELELFIKQYRLRFNDVSRKIEINGKPITDRDLNTIYVNAMHAIDHNINKQKLWDMIDSDLTPNYNPFHEFFKQHKDLKPKGLIKELLNCIDYVKPDLDDSEMTEDEQLADYLEVFITRWLVSIISAMHGTYSLLVLVLTGGQGTGKSKFFRGLLPEDLKEYYAENKLEKEKEGGVLMTQKLIVMDDEFSGKNKKDSAAFKEISSRETFTVRKPYGKVFEDLQRYAVLCGTSNETDILNDPTGNRRIIPVEVKSIDIKRFEAIDKTELFMELYHEWKEIGDGWMLTRKEIDFLNKANVKNEQISFEQEMISKWFEPSDTEGGNSSFLMASEMKVKIDQRSGERINIFKMSAVLKKMGFKKVKKKINGYSTYRYLVVDNFKEKTQPITEGIDF